MESLLRHRITLYLNRSMGILFLFLFETGSVYPRLVLIFSVSTHRVLGLQGLCHHAQQSMFLQTQLLDTELRNQRMQAF